MNPQQTHGTEGQPEVPAQIFEQFLTTLQKNSVASDIIERLRATIVIKHDHLSAAV
jgi:hypothetical protein